MKEVKRNERMGLVESGVREPFFFIPCFLALEAIRSFPIDPEKLWGRIRDGACTKPDTVYECLHVA